MKKLKVWLVVALVFVAGFASGVVTTRIVTRRVIAAVIAHPDLVRAKIERELDRKLRLDAQQRAQVGQILSDTRDQLKDLRKEFQPRFAETIGNSRERINAVLRPEQQARFEDYQATHRYLFPAK